MVASVPPACEQDPVLGNASTLLLLVMLRIPTASSRKQNLCRTIVPPSNRNRQMVRGYRHTNMTSQSLDAGVHPACCCLIYASCLEINAL